eukprot:403352327
MENIEVAVRLRPLNQREFQLKDESICNIEKNEKTITLNQQKLLQSPKFGKKTEFTLSSKNGLNESTSPLNQTAQLLNINSKVQITPNNRKQLISTPGSVITSIQNLKGTQSKSPINRKVTFENKTDKSPMIQSKLQISQQQDQRVVLKHTLEKITSQPALLKGSSFVSSQNSSFITDQCFKEDDTNYHIYDSMVKRIALSSLNGINGTVFMYGQTGSGKTYSMLGRERKEIIPLFNQQENTSNLQQAALQKKQSKNGMIHKDRQDKAKEPQKSKKSNNLSISAFDTNTGEAINMEMNYLSGRSQEKVAAEKSSEQPGVLIYALQDIFKEINNDQDKTYFLRCSYIEIYNEQVYDLLRTEDCLLSEPLHLNEDKNKDFYIRGVIEEPVTSIDEILYYLRRGELNRHYAETKLNHSSSRSHTLFRLQVQSITNNFLQQENSQAFNTSMSSVSPQKVMAPNKELRKYVTQSVLNFVDLAGSERVSSHYDNKDPDELFVTNFGDQVPTIDSNVKNRVNEGKNINKSLFFLTQVISMRAEGKGLQSMQIDSNSKSPLKQSSQYQHIPYRNSPLTKILRSSLGGNSRTCVIICVTPAKSQIEQTLSSLRFGQNAMKIENKVQANIISNNNEEAVKILITDYERKIKSLEKAKKDLQKQREQESKIIEQLIDEKKRLFEKLTNQNIKKLNQNMQLNILESYIKICKEEDIKPEKYQLIMSNVGLIDINANLLQKTNQDNLQRDQSTNLEDQSFKLYGIQSQLQINKVINAEQKTQIIYQKEQIQSLVDCISELKQKNHQLEDQLSEASNLITDKLCSLTVDEKEFQMLKMKEQFYESFNKSYLKSLGTDQIHNLENQFSQYAEICKKHLMKSSYRSKIKLIQDQIAKLSQQEEMIKNQDQFKELEEALAYMQMSQDQSVIEKSLNILSNEEMCEHHKKTTLEYKVNEQSLEKIRLVTKLKEVQNSISLSINEHSYMNQVSEENQRKVNGIIERQALINQCEQKIQQLTQKYSNLNNNKGLIQQNISNKKSRQLQPNYQSQSFNISKNNSISQTRVKQENLLLRESFNTQRQTISLSPNMKSGNYQKFSTSKKQYSKIKDLKNQHTQASLQKQQKSPEIDRSDSNLQLNQSFNKAILQIEEVDFKFKSQDQLFQVKNQRKCSDEDITQYDALHQSNDFSQSFIEKENDHQQMIIDSFAMTYRESHPEITSNNLFETLQNNVGSFAQENSQPQIIINLNDYVSFKQSSDQKVQPQVLDQVFGNQRMSKNNLIFNQSHHSQNQSISQSDDSKYESANPKQNPHHKSFRSQDSQGILSINFNKINIKDIDQIDQALRQSLYEITQSLRMGLQSKDQSFSQDDNLQLRQPKQKNINDENLQLYEAQISQSSSSDISSINFQLNDVYQTQQRNSINSQQENTLRNNLSVSNSKFLRQSVQNLQLKKNDMKDYQPLLSNRNKNLKGQLQTKNTGKLSQIK